MTEQVNHPSHYAAPDVEAKPILETLGLYANAECINVIDAFNLNFSLGSAIKYLWRLNAKGDRLTNLQKAKWYLEHELNNRFSSGCLRVSSQELILSGQQLVEAIALIDELLAQHEPAADLKMTTRI